MPNQPAKGHTQHQLRVDEDLWQAAKLKAAENGETITDVLRKALRRYVSNVGRPRKPRG